MYRAIKYFPNWFLGKFLKLKAFFTWFFTRYFHTF